MVYITDLQNLISQWIERVGNAAYDSPYREGLSECAYELTQLINRSIQESLEYQDALDMWAAEEYEASINAA